MVRIRPTHVSPGGKLEPGKMANCLRICAQFNSYLDPPDCDLSPGKGKPCKLVSFTRQGLLSCEGLFYREFKMEEGDLERAEVSQ